MQSIARICKSVNVKLYYLAILIAGSGLFTNASKVEAEITAEQEACIHDGTNKHWQELEQTGKLSDLKSPSRELSLCCEEKIGTDREICYETRKQTIADMASHNAFYLESSSVVLSCCSRYCLETVPEKAKAEGSSVTEECAKCRIKCLSETSHLAQTLHGDLVFTYGCKSSTTP